MIESLVEEVARNPRGGDVLARRRLLAPPGIGVHGVERDLTARDHLDLRDHRRPLAQDAEAELDPDRLADVHVVTRRSVAAHDPDRPQPHEIVARRCLVVRPRVARPGAGGRLEVVRDDFPARAVARNAAPFEEQRSVAELRDRLHVVRDEEHGSTGGPDLFHTAEASGLELRVADGEDLVDQEDLGLEVRGDRECEPHVHSARVPLDRRVDEPLDTRELDDLAKLLLDLAPLHAEDRAVQVDVLAPGQLGVEAGSDLEQAPDAAPDLGATLRRGRDPREDLEKRRLARTVAARRRPAPRLPATSNETSRSAQIVLTLGSGARVRSTRALRAKRLAKRPVGGLKLTDPVALREPLGVDGDRHQIVSAKRGSEERKIVRPPDEKHDRRPPPRRRSDAVRAAFASSTAQRQPAITAVIGLNARIHCHFVGIASTAYMTPESSGSTCRKTGIMYRTSR